VDDCQSTYLRKFKKLKLKKEKKEKEKEKEPTPATDSKMAITTGHKPWYGIFLTP
jgi:hypothetical protein